MARIRTVKPDFFRHELLQELEKGHAGMCPMLVFAGLFGHCDKTGRFMWRPKHLKLDILPFLDFDMVATLAILERASLIVRYEVAGLEYGWIPTFTEHQAIGGKEAQKPARFPEPPSEVTEKYRGKNGKREGLQELGIRNEEGNKEGKRAESSAPVDKSKANGNGAAWWKSQDGIEKKARELDIKANPGESWQQLKDRIFARINA